MKSKIATCEVTPRQTINWARLSSDWEKSNHSQKEFCQQRGVSYSSFINQRSLLLSPQSPKASTVNGALVPAAKVTLSKPKTETYQIEFPSGLKLSILDDFNAQSLKQLLKLLEARSC